jgi:hypothetical protein
MVELFDVLGQVAGEAEAAGSLSTLALLLLAAKYSVDILRTKIVQRGMVGIESAFKLPDGALRWAYWSDRTRVLVSMGQAFVVGLLGSLAAGTQWLTAIGAGLAAAVGAKGLHDTGVLPGRKPSGRGPAIVIERKSKPSSDISRGLSLKTDVTSGKVVKPNNVQGGAPWAPVIMDDEPTEPHGPTKQ